MIDNIGRPVTVRIYGKTLNTWTVEKQHPYWEDKTMTVTTQYEVAYKEYDSESLQLVNAGSEDFSSARIKAEVMHKGIFTWDGETYRRDGKRKFDYRGMFEFRKSERDAVKDYFKKLYHAEYVDFRY